MSKLKNSKLQIIFLTLFYGCFTNCLIAQNKKYELLTIKTKFGEMKAVLYNKTPKHKANFLKLVNEKFYDSTTFHRVIKYFMIQGGDPNSKVINNSKPLGSGDVGYKVPAEILPELFHKKGALAAARDGNPEKASSGSQFYIVQGKIWNETDLEIQMNRSGRPFTEQQKMVYRTIGGSPHLDGNYTVFGEIVSGMSVVDSITNQPLGPRDQPKTNITMRITAKKIKKRKILKKYGVDIND
jgi:cyclophilin family peptidyl-prolyl cis-trans isomerase